MTPVDIDPKTGAPIVKGPIVSIPPAVTSSTPPPVLNEGVKVSGAAVVEIPDVSSTLTRKEAVLAEIQRILKEHNGNIGDIGLNNKYWDLVNEYRIL